ncbi:hypothetical protein EV182_001585 [Spiromyces aspiralis]|uniref:Uncharacterized protein n=1 Tax=Spiromyces aspiralis TaxID=68401 RepID=A0ACC1HSX7_9FUNG|nr:hypothetical protein EV182_001585 [Spiromyces aspiralis]
MYHQGFWQRTFASRTNRDLLWSTVIGFCLSFPLFTLIGMAGPLAAWSGTWSPPQTDDDPPASMTFFSILAAAPGWVAGLTLVLSTSLSCCAMDTLQCTLAASLYDLVEQRIGMYIIRAIVILLNVPIIVLAMRAPDVLQIWLFADLLACATVLPVLFGLIPKLNFLVQWDAFVGCAAGIISVGIAGTIYFHDSDRGWKLLMIDGGLYVDDYSVLTAFLVAPIFSALFTFISAGVRIGIYILISKKYPVYQNHTKIHHPTDSNDSWSPAQEGQPGGAGTLEFGNAAASQSHFDMDVATATPTGVSRISGGSNFGRRLKFWLRPRHANTQKYKQ